MRIALFGGTFDPIHRGHLALASAAADAFALDNVVFAPTGRQPLKSEAPIASFADRLAMAALACIPDKVKPAFLPPVQSPDPRFVVSSLDAPHPDGSPNFTIDLISQLCRTMPAADLFVLTGADSFLDLPRWRSPDELLTLAEWIVVSRPGSPLTPAFWDLPQFATLALTPTQRARVHLLATVHEEVSATDLRHRLQAGDPCPGLLPPAVAAYIHSHHLYL
jgi:nicotinate-nucleotide adenylyltransferase